MNVKQFVALIVSGALLIGVVLLVGRGGVEKQSTEDGVSAIEKRGPEVERSSPTTLSGRDLEGSRENMEQDGFPGPEEKESAEVQDWSGHVYNVKGEVLQGANIRLSRAWSGDDRILAEGTADLNGQFVLNYTVVGEFDLAMTCEAPGYSTQRVEGINQAGGRNFYLKPLASVVAGVIYTTDGTPCEGAQVSIWGSLDRVPSLLSRTESGPDGGFRFSGLESGRYLVTAVRLGDGNAQQEVLAIAERACEGVELYLSGFEGSLNGIVRDANTLAPLRGVEVTDTSGYMVVSDTAGMFELPLYSSDAMVVGVWITKEGYLSSGATIRPGAGEAVLDIVPTEYAAVKVVGVPEGATPVGLFFQQRPMLTPQLVAGVTTQISRGEYIISAYGLVATNGVVCEIRAKGYERKKVKAQAWEPYDKRGAALKPVRIQPGRAVNFVVVDRVTGKPVQSVKIVRRITVPESLELANGVPDCDVGIHESFAVQGYAGVETTGSQGELRVAGLSSEATCVAIAHDAYVVAHHQVPKGKETVHVQLEPKAKTNSRLFGNLTKEGYGPLGGATVTVVNMEGVRRSTITDVNGNFEFNNLFDEGYVIGANLAAGDMKVSKVLPGVFAPSASAVAFVVE